MAFDLQKIFASLQTKKILTPTKVVGIDFGSSSIKVVELEKREGTVWLTTYGELQLGPYAGMGMGSSVKLPLQKKMEVLVDVLRETEVTAKDAVFALQLSDSFITVVSLPLGEEENITARVHVEARKYIPVPMTDVALEWTEVTRETKEETPLVRDILLVAIQNQSVADTRTLLDSVGNGSKPAEIELFSCMRAVGEREDTSLAIIDFGAGVSKLYIAEGGVLQRFHRVQSGGSHATQNIATQLGLTPEDAENQKRNHSPSDVNSGLIKSIVEQTAFRSLQEFKRVLDQYETLVGRTIEKIVITGGVVLFPDFIPFVTYTLGRQITTRNAFTKVSAPAFLEDTLLEIAPTFTVALGAALRQFES